MDGSHTDGDEQSMEVQANWGRKSVGEMWSARRKERIVSKQRRCTAVAVKKKNDYRALLGKVCLFVKRFQTEKESLAHEAKMKERRKEVINYLMYIVRKMSAVGRSGNGSRWSVSQDVCKDVQLVKGVDVTSQEWQEHWKVSTPEQLMNDETWKNKSVAGFRRKRNHP